MMILQFQFLDLQDRERELIPSFCESIKKIIFLKLNSDINRKKLSLRLRYIEDNDVGWVYWNPKEKFNTTVSDIIDGIVDSIQIVKHKNNIWKLETDNKTLIPNTHTLMDAFIRFVNYGDNKCKATGIFTDIEHEYRYQKLNALWNYHILKELGYHPYSTIVTV